LLYSRDDWQLFLDIGTLPQKAGVQPGQVRALVLKELTDNALDSGASEVTLNYIRREGGREYVIADDGTGIAPAIVPRLFLVNRPLLSSKLRRLPLRGMLGNGLRVVAGAVAASEGSLVVETRGHRLVLHVDDATGLTSIEADEPIPLIPGTVVRVMLGGRLPIDPGHDESERSRAAINIARLGKSYDGPSAPHWYSDKGLHRLFQCVKPETTTVRAVVADLGFILDDDRRARDLSRDDAAKVLAHLQSATPPVAAELLGYIGPNAFGNSYAIKTGVATIGGAHIPFVIEAWAKCSRSEERGQGEAEIALWVNRSPNFAEIAGFIYGGDLVLKGYGIRECVEGVGAGSYSIIVSIIVPFVELAGDGKAPALSPFRRTICEVVGRAAKAAHRAMARPPTTVSIKEAAWAAMERAYAEASDDGDGGSLPANARQVMYAARPSILAQIGKDRLDDKYFTQVLLPDYIAANPYQCADWDVVFDARGHFVEPHTGRSIPIGTLAVREYVGDRRSRPGPAVTLNGNILYPTSGPRNRFRNILFIEKEGFDALLDRAQIAERYDLAVMSTKGMSVTAARLLLDRLAPLIDRIFILHDFDIAGFSIFGTLATDGRRYVYKNAVNMIDLGLRLADVERMALQSEPVQVKDWPKRRVTLAKHRATHNEIAFLRDRRVELNALPSGRLVSFIEQKLAEHGVEKVVPATDIIEAHARRLIEQHLGELALDKIREEITAKAKSVRLPDDLKDRLREVLQRDPELSWDAALSCIVRLARRRGRRAVSGTAPGVRPVIIAAALDRELLARTLGMMGSSFDGEALAAARAADRLVRQAGLSWAEVITPKSPEVPHREAIDIGAVVELSGIYGRRALSAWERQFVDSLATWPEPLSAKQRAVLDRVARKLYRAATGRERAA